MGRVTVKVDIKPEANQDKEHVVRIRITKDRQPRYWPLSIAVSKSAFNKKATLKLRNWIKSTHLEHGPYNVRILEQYRKAEKVIEQFEKGDQPFSSNEIVAYLKEGGRPDLMTDYFLAHLVTRKKLAGKSLQKLRTLRQYKQANDRLCEFLSETKRQKLPIRGLTKAHVLEFQAWLSQEYAPNTVALKLTCLRKVVREAMDDGLIPYDKYPFRGVSITLRRKPVDRLREDDIDKLTDLPRQNPTKQRRVVTDRDHARPSVLLMYYMQGMRLGDFVQLRRENYFEENDERRIKYKAGKSSKERNVLLPDEAIELLGPYLNQEDGKPKEPKDLLFPYLIDTIDKLSAEDQLKYIARATSRLSAQVKALGKQIGLGKKITPHIMRHSFADLLRRNKEDLLTIQMTLGHSDPRTTQAYMDSLDQGAVDSVVKHYQRKTVVKQIDETLSNSRNSSSESEAE